MKKNKNIVVVILLIAIAALAIGFVLVPRYHKFKGHAGMKPEAAAEAVYYCPMHPGYTSDKPGDCPICGMKLVKKEQMRQMEKEAKTPKEICVLHNCPMTNCPMQITGDVKDCPFCGAHLTKGGKILYYRNPMNPEVTSPVPMKDPMGMDYVPVYEETSVEEGMSINAERQQMIGVKKEKVEKRRLTHRILTVGRIAYDPQLFIAQEEYLQAVKARGKINESALPLIKEQIKSLEVAAKRKLILLGMNEEEIEKLAKKGRPQENLYLPIAEDTVWVYMTIYEYEMGLIKEGLPVEIDAVAFPGEIFKGKIISLTPVLDPMTRSIQARAEIENPGHKLKPDMYVNVRIDIDLGERLAVSEEAVINTGKRTLVVVVNDRGNFFSRDVKVGQKAEGFYEVLEGLKEGDTIVTSGNFLIDSESRLQSAISGEHEHGQ
jgi:hypothetical protein